MGIGMIGTAINILITVLSMHAPGMTLRQLPLFVRMSMLNIVLVVLA